MKRLLLLLFILPLTAAFGQGAAGDSAAYKKRVLESAEVELLASYYSQDGDNAAVTGGVGTEKLTDLAPAIVVSIPLNDDDILTIDGSISAYTSASSSNVDPFDGTGPADPFTATSGASSGDTWVGATATYSHSSDDRNNIWSANLSVANEYDYFSIGIGGAYTRQFNQKNTELSIHGNVFLDTWFPVYPRELRPFMTGGSGILDPLFRGGAISGNPDYNPIFTEFTKTNRNSYSAGLGFSQILSRRLQASLAADFVLQDGLLSTPLQRVYFSDRDSSFIDNFRLADDVERLPGQRSKVALGGRLHYYVNERLVVRTFYRYYTDDWGIRSHTAMVELPVKIGSRFTVYPSYRFYSQTAADYFGPYSAHLSTDAYYTSDYDLSKFNASQYGLGVTYTDIFTKFHIWQFGLKSVDLRYNYYRRDTGLTAHLVSFGALFVMDR